MCCFVGCVLCCGCGLGVCVFGWGGGFCFGLGLVFFVFVFVTFSAYHEFEYILPNLKLF